MNLQDIFNSMEEPGYNLVLSEVYSALSVPKQYQVPNADAKMCRIVNVSEVHYDLAVELAPESVTFTLEFPPTKVPNSSSRQQELF